MKRARYLSTIASALALGLIGGAGSPASISQQAVVSLGDLSQPAWEDAPQWQKDSAVLGIEAIMQNPATTPEESHAGWSAVKVADGWVYGDVKDPIAKEHPCLVPYAELPLEQRVKDYLFGAVVRSLMNGQ